MKNTRPIPVSEIYGPVFQGEGEPAGLMTYFLRLGYCDGLKSGWCNWCDSLYAVDPKYKDEYWSMAPQREIYEELELRRDNTSCGVVTISGGNPALHDLDELVRSLVMQPKPWQVWVETQGTIYQDWLALCNVTVSPKPPSAGVCDETRLDKVLYQLFLRQRANPGAHATLKIPVDPAHEDGADLAFAHRVLNTYASLVRGLYLSVVTYPTDDRDTLIDRWQAVERWAVEERWTKPIHVLPQLHAISHGHKRGI